MKHFLLLLLLVGIVITGRAQKADSLLKVLPTAIDTQRVKVLNDLCMEYVYNDPEAAKAYVTEALNLATSLDYNIGRAKALNRLGIVHDVTGDYDSAIICYQYAGVYYAKANNKKGKASTLNNIGMLYTSTSGYQRALSNYYAALKIFKEINDDENTANCLNNIGIVYSYLGTRTASLRYFKEAEAIYKQLDNSGGLASTYTNEGLAFNNLGMKDSTIHYYSLALQIEKEIGDIYGLGILYNDIAIVYQDKNEPKKALTYLFEALKYKRMVNDKAGEASVLLNMATNYYNLKMYDKQEECMLASHQIALDIHNYRILRKTCKTLYKLYFNKKDFEKAIRFIPILSMAEDTIMNIESAKQIRDMELKYDSQRQKLEIDKKTLELENANLDIEQKRNAIISLVIISILIILTAFLLYYRYRHRKQREMDAELLHQQELRNHAIIDAEEKERIRIARELHDGVGQQLSAVKMNLSAFDADFKLTDMTAQDRMTSLLTLVDDAVKEVRTVSHNMMPNALLRSGLVSAVRDFVHKISATDSMKVDLQVIGLNERLPSTTETTLYRILQECVSNIIKHADATKISIQLIKHDVHLNMLIEDNGNGFDTSKINSYEGIGLKNIISRVQYLNGEVQFDSMTGIGTTVNIDIPVQ
jgi:two-component system NarL family sensor kinase